MNIVQSLLMTALGLALVFLIYSSLVSNLPTTEVSTPKSFQVVDVFSSIENNKQRLCLIVRGEDLNGLRVFVGEREVERNIDCKLGKDCLVCSYLSLPEGKYVVKISLGEAVVQRSVVLPKVPVPPSASLSVESPSPTLENGKNFDLYFVNSGLSITYLLQASDDEGLAYISFDCDGDGTPEYTNASPSDPFSASVTCNYPNYGDYNVVYVVKDVEGIEASVRKHVALIHLSFTNPIALSGKNPKRYTKTLMHGDHNAILVSLSGPAGYTYQVGGDIQPATVVPDGGSTSTETLAHGYDRRVVLDVTGSVGTDSMWLPADIAYVLFCSSSTECSQDLQALLNEPSTPRILFANLDGPLTVDVSQLSGSVIVDANAHTLSLILDYTKEAVPGKADNLTITEIGGKPSLSLEVNTEVCCVGVEPFVNCTYDSPVLTRVDLANITISETPYTPVCFDGSGNPDLKLSVRTEDANSEIYILGREDYSLGSYVDLLLSVSCSNGFVLETNTDDVRTSGGKLIVSGSDCIVTVPP